MNIRTWWRKLVGWKKKRAGAAMPPMPMAGPSQDSMRKMLSMVARTEAEELSCDDVYRLLDEFAEMIARGEDAASVMPMVKHHVDMCPDCREEFEALVRVLEHQA